MALAYLVWVEKVESGYGSRADWSKNKPVRDQAGRALDRLHRRAWKLGAKNFALLRAMGIGLFNNPVPSLVDSGKGLYSVTQVSELVGRTRSHILCLIQAGEIEAFERIGPGLRRRIFYLKADEVRRLQNMFISPSELFSVQDVALACGVTSTSVHVWIMRGVFRPYRWLGHFMFERNEIRKFLLKRDGGSLRKVIKTTAKRRSK